MLLRSLTQKIYIKGDKARPIFMFSRAKLYRAICAVSSVSTLLSNANYISDCNLQLAPHLAKRITYFKNSYFKLLRASFQSETLIALVLVLTEIYLAQVALRWVCLYMYIHIVCFEWNGLESDAFDIMDLYAVENELAPSWYLIYCE